jgi:hypothetical protein
MTQEQATAIVESLVEHLAAIEHDRWAHWQRHMHGKGQKQTDGSLMLPAELVGQWEKQIETPYSRLSEQEKESDREQVRKYLPLIIEAFSNQ